MAPYLSVEQASTVGQETRKQSDSKLWFEQCAGRVTASKFYSVLHTNQSQPSVSLIKSICYPEAVRFFQMLAHMDVNMRMMQDKFMQNE